MHAEHIRGPTIPRVVGLTLFKMWPPRMPTAIAATKYNSWEKEQKLPSGACLNSNGDIIKKLKRAEELEILLPRRRSQSLGGGKGSDVSLLKTFSIGADL